MVQAPSVTGGYVRHRDRMIQESVFQDLRDTLIACRWMPGTTSRPVGNPWTGEWDLVTTPLDGPNGVLPLVGVREDGTRAEVVLIDYFPDSGPKDEESDSTRKTELNTLAIDTGVPQEPELLELGSNFMQQPYIFTMAFYASSDAVALAVMNDLRDRYLGRIVRPDFINLFDYNAPNFSDESLPVVRMEVDGFRYQQNAEMVSPWEVHLYFAEVALTDFVDDAGFGERHAGMNEPTP